MDINKIDLVRFLSNLITRKIHPVLNYYRKRFDRYIPLGGNNVAEGNSLRKSGA